MHLELPESSTFCFTAGIPSASVLNLFRAVYDAAFLPSDS